MGPAWAGPEGVLGGFFYVRGVFGVGVCVVVDVGPGHNITFVITSSGRIAVSGEADSITIDVYEGEYWLVISLIDGSRIEVKITDARLAKKLLSILGK